MASAELFHHRVDCTTGEVERVPFTKAEAAQRKKDEAAYAKRVVAEEKEQAKLDELKAALRAGEATPEQLQKALALMMDVAP